MQYVLIAVASILAVVTAVLIIALFKYSRRNKSYSSILKEVDNQKRILEELKEQTNLQIQTNKDKIRYYYEMDHLAKQATERYNDIHSKSVGEQAKLEAISSHIAQLEQHYNGQEDILKNRLNERFSALCQIYKTKSEELGSLYDNKRLNFQQEINQVQEELSGIKQKLEIATEQLREANENEDSHYIQLTTSDIFEIKELNEVCGKLRNPVPLYKAIYEVYIKTPLSTLIEGLNVRGVCGIYKLTNKNNGMIYIGQSVDIANRWRQHVKRGCGAEIGTIAGTKLYNAMLNDGIWNFKFEILQECENGKLNELEKYWIDFFGTSKYGYNMKAGG